MLLDTEAHVTILKYACISDPSMIDTTDKVWLSGITHERTPSIGSIKMNLIFEHLSIEHRVHIVGDDFPIPSHGMLGKDFTVPYNCILDYGQMVFTVQPKGVLPACISIQHEIIKNLSVLPPRSETFKMFRIKSEQYPCIVESQSIAENVWVPTTVIHQPETWIRVLNVNNELQYVQTDRLQVQPIDNFHILKCNSSHEPNGRRELLRNTLKSKIPKHAQDKLMPMCEEFGDIFHLTGDKLTTNNFYTQKLGVRDHEPVFVKNYRLPQSQKAEVDSQVQKLLRDDLIELSTSNYNSPLIIVPKKSTDGKPKWRLCVDYRLLNKKLIPDKHPLPRIDEILDGLGRARYFSVMDLHSGYHQIPLAPESRPLTSFSAGNGYYQFKVLPFGISIAPAAFTRMMSIAFAGLTPEQAFIYMDDLIVIGFSENQHLNNLRRVFDTCRKFNLKLNPEKCNFFKSEVYFLGHKCTPDGILPDPSKLFAVRNYPTPKTAEETKRFTAFANYYRRFIRNFSGIAQPLNALTKKRVEFKWTEECESAFQILKEKLSSNPVLAYPDFTKPFKVTVDASHSACGGVLSQEHDGQDRPIMYISRTFKKCEANKAIIEKELLAIHFAVTVLRPYLYGRHFTVYSDHKPLIYLYKMKCPSSKLTRIRLDIEEYDFEVVHISGKSNVVADALSRIHIEDLKNMYEYEIFAITRAMSKEIDAANKDSETVSNTQQNDASFLLREKVNSGLLHRVIHAKLIKVVTNGNTILSITIGIYKNHKKLFDCNLTADRNETISLGNLISKLDKTALAYQVNKIQWPLFDKMFKFCSVEEFKQSCRDNLKNVELILVQRPPRVTKKEDKLSILEKFHTDELHGGHCGQKRLYAKLRESYYWPQMTRDIAKFVKNCHICKLTKPGPKTRQELSLTDTPIQPLDIVQIDTIGPMQKSNSGFQYAVTIIDELSKFLVIIPTIDKSAKTVARAIFENFVLRYGAMRTIKTDRGTEYLNEVLKELCVLMKSDHLVSTAYHHETLGTVERSHRLLNEYLRAYLNGNLAEWDTYAQYFSFCYNTTPNASNDFVYSPFEILFGRKPTQILTSNVTLAPLYNIDNVVQEIKYRLTRAHLETRKLIEKIKIRNKIQYDKDINVVKFNVGDRIKIINQPYDKFKYIYSGPFEIIKVEDKNVIINLNGKEYKIHQNRIIQYDK